jgi:cellulose synthase/poly-beta-1,6-N-acetylglucosamine synthase-like glycosyltransferase
MKQKPKLSVVITAFREEGTIGKAIESVKSQIDMGVDDLWVVAPDSQTISVAEKFSGVKVYKDPGNGKPTALNLIFEKVTGDIVVLTDGDVWMDKKAIKNLTSKFKEKGVGIVSSRPVSLNDKSTLFGYWAYLLTEAAHLIRIQRNLKGEFLDCSGYLLAIRKNLFAHIPADHLTEDAFLSQHVYAKGFKTMYAPEARVLVKFPANFKDWLKQKTRSVGGASQKNIAVPMMRGIKQEVSQAKILLSLPKSVLEYWYLFLLFCARGYLWLNIFWKLKVKKLPFDKVWLRVESTK